MMVNPEYRSSVRDFRVRPLCCAKSGFSEEYLGYEFATFQNPVWTLPTVLVATGGRIISGGYFKGFRSISTDTRTIEPGDLFIALKGGNYDGHDFLQAAMHKGAAGLLVSRLPEHPLPLAGPVILVKDTLKAIGDLAAYRRSLMQDLRVMAITGSSGKTTLKEMLAAVLSNGNRDHSGPGYRVLKNRGNFNNLIGLPLTLLSLDYGHDVAVLEMGMNRPGEIARLTEIADPDIACILNVQEAHLAGVKDLAGVAKAKGELFAGIKSWGKLAVNIDDKRVRALAKKCPQRQITFGCNSRAYVRATHVRALGEEGTVLTLHIGPDRARVTVKAIGRHNVTNILAAAAMAYGVGMDLPGIVRGLATFRPFAKRLQLQKVAGGPRVINDTYNANPASMLAALETLDDLKREHRGVAVLGDMLELGGQSAEAHRRTGEAAARLGIDHLLTVGSFSHDVLQGARDAGMAEEASEEFQGKDELAARLEEMLAGHELSEKDWILVKGSRAMRMETIVDKITGRKA